MGKVYHLLRGNGASNGDLKGGLLPRTKPVHVDRKEEEVVGHCDAGEILRWRFAGVQAAVWLCRSDEEVAVLEVIVPGPDV